jgi:tRNA A-37 threonylcarbamoyl transferase component Bud32
MVRSSHRTNSARQGPEDHPMLNKRITSHLPSEECNELVQRMENLPNQATFIRDRKNQVVYKLDFHEAEVLAKQYRLKKFSSQLIATLGFSRARRSYRNGFKLLEEGILTPRPLLIIENGFPLRQLNYLATEWLPGRQLLEFLQDHPPSTYPPLIEQIVELVHKLHGNGYSHGDFHHRNLIVGDNNIIFLIDLDNVRKHALKSRLLHRYKRDRARVLYSLEEFPKFRQLLDEALPHEI